MKRSNVVWTLVAASALAASVAMGQMIDPAIDRSDEPFCYFSQPTDVIGVMDGQEATLVTPEGYLYTGWGEYMFFTGNPPIPVNQRVKTLLKGYLPVIDYSFQRDGLDYHVRMFATTLDGNPESPLMNFVRVNVVNKGKSRRVGYFGVATRYQNDANSNWGCVGDNRFGRPVKAKVLGQFEQSGVAFSMDWDYAFGDGLFLRNDSVMYLFPEGVSRTTMLTLKTGYNDPPDREPGKKWILPTTPVGAVLYKLSLNRDEHVELEFKMPYEPIPRDSPLLRELRDASFDNCLGRVVTFWEEMFARGIDIGLPEEKVVNTFKANLVYELIARNKQEGNCIQKVNEFQYDAFWLRDAAYIVRSYDLSGYHQIARQCLDFFPRWQQPDGNFVSQGGQFDGWGQTLWAFGQHYRIARDTAYAISVYPLIVKAVEWLRAAREGDPFRLVPVTTPGDNEQITGHVTGHNLWALVGLKQAIIIARDIGKTDDADAFQADFDSLREAFINRLSTISSRAHGSIPPGLDTLGGNDWDNMSALYPEVLLDPHDPMVSATLATTRAKYQEGLMTYGSGRWLHHYLTLANTESEIIRGDQEDAVRDLYAVLVHTSATHAGFEYSIRPWGDRDFGMNLSPHGWFSARYRSVLRNMLVREQDDQLHLLSSVSPEWIRDGKTISVRQAPTEFGPVSFTLTVRGTTARLVINPKFIRTPEALILHVPWFMDVRSVKVNGKAVVAGTNRSLTLPAGVKTVDLRWVKRKGVPALSYARSVEEFKREYRHRYETFRTVGALPD